MLSHWRIFIDVMSHAYSSSRIYTSIANNILTPNIARTILPEKWTIPRAIANKGSRYIYTTFDTLFWRRGDLSPPRIAFDPNKRINFLKKSQIPMPLAALSQKYSIPWRSHTYTSSRSSEIRLCKFFEKTFRPTLPSLTETRQIEFTRACKRSARAVWLIRLDANQ